MKANFSDIRAAIGEEDTGEALKILDANEHLRDNPETSFYILDYLKNAKNPEWPIEETFSSYDDWGALYLGSLPTHNPHFGSSPAWGRDLPLKYKYLAPPPKWVFPDPIIFNFTKRLDGVVNYFDQYKKKQPFRSLEHWENFFSHMLMCMSPIVGSPDFHRHAKDCLPACPDYENFGTPGGLRFARKVGLDYHHLDLQKPQAKSLIHHLYFKHEEGDLVSYYL
jgi:hypothetical protein